MQREVQDMEDDDRAYEAARDEALTGEADEELAETQEALSEEAEVRDAALSEVPTDPHAAEREELHGNSLVWWRDTSLLDAYAVMADTFAEVQEQHRHAKMLIEEGVPADSIKSSLELNFLYGPVVMGALQILGLWVPEVRETVKEILAAIPVPEPTEEEAEAIKAAYEAIQERTLAQLRSFAEAARLEETKATDDAELGLDPN